MFEFFETLAPENEERLSDKRADKIKASVLSRIEEDKPMKKHFRIKPLLIAAIISAVAVGSAVITSAATDSGLFKLQINGQVIESDVDLSEIDVFNQPQGLKLTFDEETGEVAVEPVDEGANVFYISLTMSNSIEKLGFTTDMNGHMEVYTGDDVAVLEKITEAVEGKYIYVWHAAGGHNMICPADDDDCCSTFHSERRSEEISRIYGYYDNDGTIHRINQYYWDRISPDEQFIFSIEYENGEYKPVLNFYKYKNGRYKLMPNSYKPEK